MSVLSDGYHLLEEAVRQTGQAVYVLDETGAIVLFNAACERLTGRSAPTMLGQSCRYHGPLGDHVSSLEASLAPPPELLADPSLPAKSWSLAPMADGQRAWCVIHFWPLAADDGRVRCVAALIAPTPGAAPPHDELIDPHARLLRLRERLARRYGIDCLVGESPVARRLIEQVRAAGASDWPVLITGQPGTGKALTARTIHYAGARQCGPFVIVCTSGLSPEQVDLQLWGDPELITFEDQPRGATLYAASRGGTLYVEDIAALPRESQARLAAELAGGAEGEDEAGRPPRVILGASTSPAELLAGGGVRPDLLYAASVLTIHLPPLRDRAEDIPLLAQHFVEQRNAVCSEQMAGLNPEATELAAAYPWPGNLAELREVVDEACRRAGGPKIQPADLPARLRGETTVAGAVTRLGDTHRPLDEVLAEVERTLIEQAIARARGNKSQAAEMLNVSRPRLYRRMEQLGIDDPGAGPTMHVNRGE